jgi:hypothetical protein
MAPKGVLLRERHCSLGDAIMQSSGLLRPRSPGMLACTRDNRHQTNEGQYKPVTFDSTVVLLRHTANTPST